MSPAAAGGKRPPSTNEIEELLGKAGAHWRSLGEQLASAFGPLDEKWTYTPKTERWMLRLIQRKQKRTVLYLTPCREHFIAAFALGEKACRAAREGGLPAPLLEAIENAPRYPEGRGVRYEVRTKREVEGIRALAAIKMAT